MQECNLDNPEVQNIRTQGLLDLKINVIENKKLSFGWFWKLPSLFCKFT
jgi:hypothetical protein